MHQFSSAICAAATLPSHWNLHAINTSEKKKKRNFRHQEIYCSHASQFTAYDYSVLGLYARYSLPYGHLQSRATKEKNEISQLEALSKFATRNDMHTKKKLLRLCSHFSLPLITIKKSEKILL